MADKVSIDDNKRNNLFSRIADRIPARMVLYFLSWSGFLVSFMLRNDINLAIVAMVEPGAKINESTIAKSEYCFTVEDDDVASSAVNYGGTLQWSSKVQSYVIAAFYWAYILSQVFGGMATQKLGTKVVFGYSQLVTAICSLSIPWASDVHYGIVIGLRFIQGFASGLTWPAMYGLVGHWIPINERSRFMSSFQGFSMGIGLTYPLCGFLIAYFGWRSVFYTTGSIGLMWCVVWYFLAFNSPETHPRISAKEQEYIKNHTETTYEISKQQVVPWRAILTSMPAWAIAITTFGRIWVHYTFITSGPLYMKNVLGFSIEKNGVLSGAPFICSYFTTVLFCYIADKLSKNNCMSLTNVRKLMTASSQVGPGLLVILIVYLGCNINLLLMVWFLAVSLITASYAGAMANIVDIAPNFAGPTLAFAQTIHMTASFLSPLASFHILDGQESLMSSWRSVFYVTAFVAISTYAVFQIWGTAEVQSWNNNSSPEDKALVTMEEKPQVLILNSPAHVIYVVSSNEEKC